MKTMQKRYRQLEEDPRSKYVQIFKNQGKDAGASQSHSHWQITSLWCRSVKNGAYVRCFKELLRMSE